MHENKISLSNSFYVSHIIYAQKESGNERSVSIEHDLKYSNFKLQINPMKTATFLDNIFAQYHPQIRGVKSPSINYTGLVSS